MQLAIELPDELGQELLKHADVQSFVQRAIKKMLLEEKQSSGLLIDIVAGLPEIACFKDKDPLELQRAWRDEWN